MNRELLIILHLKFIIIKYSNILVLLKVEVKLLVTNKAYNFMKQNLRINEYYLFLTKL